MVTTADPFPPVRVVSGPAFELIAQLAAFTSGPARPSLESGKTWIRQVREVAGPELVRGVERWALPLYADLVPFALEAGPPYAPGQLVKRLRAVTPNVLWRRFLGADSISTRAMFSDGAIDRAMAGDARARAELVEASGNNPSARQSLERLLATRPEFVQAEIAALIETWTSRVFPVFAGEALRHITHDVETKARQFARISGREAIRIATNGVEFSALGWATEVVIIPTFALRPFITPIEAGTRAILLCSVADEALDADPAAPPRRLVQMAAALGDATRLRILHELGEGDLSASELAERLSFERTSLHHHLGILRSAGLVTAHAEGVHSWRYSVRADGITSVADALTSYLSTPEE